MTRRAVHFELEILAYTLSQPLCENQAGRDAIADVERKVEMTDDESAVTCRRCLTALWYEAAPIERLTAVEADPVRRAA